jgi:small basic protein
MDIITALAVSIGLLAGVATWLFLGPMGELGLSLWAVFVAWATFYHCGGKEAGLQKTIVHNIFGAFLGWIALLAISQMSLGATLGVPLWAAICVTISVFVLVIAAKNPMFSDIPAAVFGYASIAALALAGGKLSAVSAASLENPFVNIMISMVIGALFGYVSEKVASAMVAKASPAVTAR